ncbi:MAG: type II secretion system protein GspM [Burkholderiales bacterium]
MSRPASNPAPSANGRSSRLMPASWIATLDALQARWTALAARERAGLTAATVVLGFLLLWSVAVQPAWRTLREAPGRIDRQGAELQAVQRLAAEAAELRVVAPISSAQSSAALQGATARLAGRATLQLQGDRATVSVNGLSGDELRDWLAEVRSAARARATEVQLTRSAQGYAGTLVLSLGSSR